MLNYVTCRAKLHNRVTEVCHTLPHPTQSVVVFVAYFAVAAPGPNENVEANQLAENDIERVVTKNKK